ncbi:MAG: hypothetical protein FWF75_07725, partial [Propionibacteriaceae bacterium]|nr:hypothetical protein [Propionibacteriaceae bacterium]
MSADGQCCQAQLRVAAHEDVDALAVAGRGAVDETVFERVNGIWEAWMPRVLRAVDRDRVDIDAVFQALPDAVVGCHGIIIRCTGETRTAQVIDLVMWVFLAAGASR